MTKTITTITDLISIESDYQKREGERYLKQLEQIQALGFSPVLEYNNDNQSFTLYLSAEKTHKIYKQEYNGQWSIWSARHFSNINYDGEKRLADTLTPPNNFKVLTAKIISAWVDYYNKLDSLKKDLALEAIQKHAEFLTKLDNLVKMKGFKLVGFSDNKHGWLEYYPNGDKGGYMSLEFSLEANGYISQNVRLSGVYNIDDFTLFIKSLK